MTRVLGGFQNKIINDTKTALETTWSSSKIEQAFTGFVPDGGGNANIDDDETSTDTVWSSQKVADLLEALNNKIEVLETRILELENAPEMDLGPLSSAITQLNDIIG